MDEKRPVLYLSIQKNLFSSKKILLAVLSGILLTASFPPLGLSFLAWFALVPLLISISNESPSKAFRLGFIAGTVHYLSLIYWIVIVLGRYGNLNIFLSSFACFLVCIYLALFIALFAILASSLNNTRFAALLMASFWIGLETVRTKYLIEFPWCLLGYTQYKNLHLIQIADILGVYGVSFLIVLINGLIFHLLFESPHGTTKKKGIGFLKWEIPITCLITMGILGYGHYRLSEGQEQNENHQVLKVVIVQGNIDQSLKWDPAYQVKTLETYLKLTRENYDFKPGLIVWPETSIPFFFQDNVNLSLKLTSLVQEFNAPLLFGSPAYKRTAGTIKYYNRAYLISPDGNPPQSYDKVHLVPFGEYVPLKKLLSFINRLVSAAGDFAKGEEIVTINHNNLSIGVLICFEAIFPEIARVHTIKGANILVNITNDAWFGKTSAPYQHLAMAVFRAVENRRPLIRSANTGFSAFIGPQGKIIARGNLFCEETLTVSPDISNSDLTFYTRSGDIFAFSMLLISLIKSASFLWRSKMSGRITKK